MTGADKRRRWKASKQETHLRQTDNTAKPNNGARQSNTHELLLPPVLPSPRYRCVLVTSTSQFVTLGNTNFSMSGKVNTCNPVDGSSSNTDCDQDSDVSFMNDIDEEIDTDQIEEEDWIVS